MLLACYCFGFFPAFKLAYAFYFFLPFSFIAWISGTFGLQQRQRLHAPRKGNGHCFLSG
jgi:hypothetical protein